jgi:outer membrane murein-binding lipoprotein Lpp
VGTALGDVAGVTSAVALSSSVLTGVAAGAYTGTNAKGEPTKAELQATVEQQNDKIESLEQENDGLEQEVKEANHSNPDIDTSDRTAQCGPHC